MGSSSRPDRQRIILYHGTSETRFSSIMIEGVVRCAPYGIRCVSLSPNIEVAKYFAQLAADTDDCDPIILRVARVRLESAGYDLDEISDDVWGDGECDWEEEVACWNDIPVEMFSVVE